MAMLGALLMTAGAGGINGSYAIPTKYIKRWSFESTWLVFSLMTFVLGPWLFLYAYSQNGWLGLLQLWRAVSFSHLSQLFTGGFLFGCGQIGFAWALKRIGMGLAFVINIGLSVVLGSFLPLFLHHTGFTWIPLGFTLLGVMIILLGLGISYRAGESRKSSDGAVVDNRKAYIYGVLSAVVAGLGSAGQNFTFALNHDALMGYAQLVGFSTLAAKTAVWPFFLTFSFIPYASYMLYLNVKNRSFHEYVTAEKRYYFYSVLMMLGWYGSLILYSYAVMEVGQLGTVVIWPLFMSMIILTSNFWGWCFGEWRDASLKTKRLAVYGLLCFILSLPCFAYATYWLSMY
jgi:L-rhamnose-H+ transport protein